MKHCNVTRRRLIQGVGASVLLPLPVWASEKEFAIRNKKGSDILNRALFEKSFWDDSTKTQYSQKNHDEIRLKSMDNGYLTYISGCGDRDFSIENVAEAVFWHQKELPNHMAGAVACTLLGSGTDSVIQQKYTDTFLLGDFDFFYSTYFQRMYRFDLADGRVVLPFEIIPRSFVSSEEWKMFQGRKQELIESTKDKRRGFLFGDVLDMAELYGMYVVSPGDVHKSRVTMIARLRFGGDSWIADFGSKLPFVLRAGLANGFRAHVDIVKKVMSGTYKR
ncbi:MAG: hypothetical protein CL916_04565 [Deltaproteobacteria bacterium]|nr:hypothetical protein [Deltaproteobacteria bacterium]